MVGISGMTKLANAASVSSAAKGLKAFTKKGYRLLSKETGIKLDSYQKAALKNILPENASSMDIVVIESKFGGGHKHITTIKDEKGGLLKRIISEFEKDKEISKTVNKYSSNEAKTFLVRERNKYAEGKNVSEIREAFSIKKDENNYIGHCKLTRNTDNTGNRHEKQVYESLQKHEKGVERKFVETEAVRLADGRLVDKKVVSNVGDVEELKKDPYLFIRNYNNADFLQAIVPYAKKMQGVSGRNIHFSDKRISGKTLGFSQPLPFYKRVVVDSQKSSKSRIVDIVNHEFRHQWQHQLLKDFNFMNFFFKKEAKKITPENAEMARKLWKANILYCRPEISYKKYRSNFKEVDARAAGEKAKKEFDYYGKELADLFLPAKKNVPVKTDP